MKFQQAFYGNDGGGYRLLGISSPIFSDIVETLCGKIGTPDVTLEFQPILFSKPIGDWLYMGYCQQGPRDHARRPTLFFHILLGNLADCQSAGLNAWVLLQNGYFQSKFLGDVSEIVIEKGLTASQPVDAPFQWNGDALAIQSNHPENELICRLVGEQINSTAWAGFCYRATSDFTVFGLATSAGIPADIECRDTKGEKIASPRRNVYAISQQENGEVGSSEKSSPSKNHVSGVLFFLSLLANVILVLFLLRGKNITTTPSGGAAPENTSQIQELKAENTRLREICAKFESFDFKKRLQGTQSIKIWDKSNPDLKADSSPVDTAFLSDLEELFQSVTKNTQE